MKEFASTRILTAGEPTVRSCTEPSNPGSSEWQIWRAIWSRIIKSQNGCLRRFRMGDSIIGWAMWRTGVSLETDYGETRFQSGCQRTGRKFRLLDHLRSWSNFLVKRSLICIEISLTTLLSHQNKEKEIFEELKKFSTAGLNLAPCPSQPSDGPISLKKSSKNDSPEISSQKESIKLEAGSTLWTSSLQLSETTRPTRTWLWMELCLQRMDKRCQNERRIILTPSIWWTSTLRML